MPERADSALAVTCPTRPHRVVALAYDGLCTFEFGCVVEIFSLNRPELGVSWYEFSVAAVEPGPLRAQGGFTVQVEHGLEALDQADTILIPGWRGLDAPVPEALCAALRAAHARGARLASICSGVFVLAAAGLLDGRRATTHWRYAEVLAARHPAIAVEPDVLYVDEGSLISSAGSAAGLDMLIHLVRRDFGPGVANAVARRLVVPPHREGGQAQYVPRPVAPEARNRLGELLDWMAANLDQELSVEALAARVFMSTRTFQRQFREATGTSPYEWLLRRRVALAQELLEAGRLPLETIGRTAGFGSEESFRYHFRRVAGVSPGAWRKRFIQTPA